MNRRPQRRSQGEAIIGKVVVIEMRRNNQSFRKETVLASRRGEGKNG